MKTKEFVKEVRAMGLDAAESEKSISIYEGFGQVAYINKYKIFCVNTDYDSFYNLSKELQEKLYNLMDEYTRTPLEDREEPQKYYLMNKWLKNIDNHKCFLNRFLDSYYFLGNITEISSFKTQFTQAEIDEIKEKFNVSLKDFEKIPVEEVEDEE